MPPIPQRTLNNLIERFLVLQSGGELRSMQLRKWSNADTARTLLGESRLNSLSYPEANELYRSLPIHQKKRKGFLENPIEEIQECLWFLLHEELMYEIRVWEFLDEMGGYKLLTADLSLAAALLCTKDPDLFGPINGNVDKALKVLGMYPVFNRNESNAGKFQKYQEILFHITRLAGFGDFRVTDDFLEAKAKGMLEETSTWPSPQTH